MWDLFRIIFSKNIKVNILDCVTWQRKTMKYGTDACFYTFSCTAKVITTLMDIYNPEFVWFICVQSLLNSIKQA